MARHLFVRWNSIEFFTLYVTPLKAESRSILQDPPSSVSLHSPPHIILQPESSRMHDVMMLSIFYSSATASEDKDRRNAHSTDQETPSPPSQLYHYVFIQLTNELA
jgi:hypothetical protein